MRVDPLIGAEAADLADGIGGGAGEADRLVRGAELAERAELGPPAQDEAAVAAACAAAAFVLLDDRDIDGGVALLQANCRPQPAEAATDDADVGAILALEGRRSFLRR